MASLRHLEVILADGVDENYPTISSTEIRFNGLEKCGHIERDLDITWPSGEASGISANKVWTSSQKNQSVEIGLQVQNYQHECVEGICSHEAFYLEQKLETTLTRYDESTYEMEPNGICRVTNKDWTQNKNPENNLGKIIKKVAIVNER